MSQRNIILISFGLFFLQFIPVLLLGENAYIRIYDVLEGEWFWYYLLAQSGTALDYGADAVVEQIMNGLPRKALPTGLNGLMFWMSSLGVYWGYWANYLAVHSIAFAGMFLLLRRYVIPDESKLYIALGIAVCFSWLPLFNTFGISAAGQPLLYFAFLNLASRKARWWDFLIVIGFPFYASIVWAGPPVLLAGAAILFYKWRQTSRISVPLLLALGLMGIAFILANLQLIELLVSPGEFVSHREEYSYFYTKPLDAASNVAHVFMTFFLGHFHAANMISIPILFALFYNWISFGRKRNEFLLVGAILGICLFYGFYNWLVYFFGQTISLIESYKFERVVILLPALWFILFALVLKRLEDHSGKPVLVLFFLVSMFSTELVANDEFQHNVRTLIRFKEKPTFKEFFATDLFSEIDEYIGQPKESYRVVHLGMHATPAQYHGFYTLDSHQSIYELAYKKKFGEIMKDELAKNEIIEKEFYQWGNRCYLYSAELGKEGVAFMIGKDEEKEIHLDIDTSPLRELGGAYLFSAIAIENAPGIGLNLEKIFEQPGSYWRIYLYKVL